MYRILCIGLVAFALGASPALAADLSVGDDAPPLTIATWVKGEPVDLSKAGPNDVHVIEFWATWCPPCRSSIPHMSELQDHFQKKVTFVGISDEKESVVRDFLTEGWNDKMRYIVAIDKKEETGKAWMQAAGQNGIPCAFIVHKGKIAWIGHPMAGLDIKVAELAGDEAFAKKAREIQKIQEEIQKAGQAEKWKDVIAAIDKLQALKPDPQMAFQKFAILAAQMKDTEAATKYAHDFVKSTTSAEALNMYAWVVLTEEDFADVRDVKLATAAAKKAVELTKEKDASIIDTYARALYDSGEKARAIEYQKKAIEICKDERMVGEFKKTLAKYESGDDTDE